MKIQLPKGYEIPENAMPGEPFEVVATLRVEEDGSIELTAIDGMKLGDGEEAGETEPAMTMPWNQESTLE